MFEQSILPGGKSRAWFVSAALLGQAAAYGLTAFIPLAYLDELPRVRRMGSLIAPRPPIRSRTKVAAAHVPKRVPMVREFDMSRLTAPAAIPKHAAIIADAEPPPGMPMSDDGAFFLAGAPIVAEEELPPPPPAPPVPAAEAAPERPVAERIRIGGKVQSGHLIHRVAPEYPPLAQQAHIQGTVELQAVVGKNGRIAELRVVSGNPLLVPAAMKAVKQWKYSPTSLNGQPVEVETSITVIFTLRRP